MSGVLCLFPTSDELTSTSTPYLMLLPLASNHTYLATCTPDYEERHESRCYFAFTSSTFFLSHLISPYFSLKLRATF